MTTTHLDALHLVYSLRERSTAFALDNLYTRDTALSNICAGYWSGPAEDGGLLSELWVEGAFPAESSSDSLGSLATDGLFSLVLADHLHAREAVPKQRPLYAHQAQAIRAAR